MKRILFLISILLLTAWQTFSQDKGYFAIAMGISIPEGDFASNDPDNSSAGLAKAGFMFDLSFASKLGDTYGIAGLIRGQALGTDAQAIADQLSVMFPFGTNGTVESGAWSAGSYLAGVYGSWPWSSKTSADARLMIGLMSAASPEFNIDILADGEIFWIKEQSATGSSVALMAGAGLKYNAGEKLCILLNLDYLYAKPKFKDVETTSSMGIRNYVTFSQPMGTINLGLGVGYRF